MTIHRVSRAQTEAALRPVANLKAEEGVAFKEVNRLLKLQAIIAYQKRTGASDGAIGSTYYQMRHDFRLKAGLPVLSTPHRKKRGTTAPEMPSFEDILAHLDAVKADIEVLRAAFGRVVNLNGHG